MLASALFALIAVTIVATSAAAAGTTITILDFEYTPDAVEVVIHDVVTWQNDGSVEHTVTSEGVFDFGPIPPGGTHAVSFGKAGTYDYGCTIHPQMRGTIVVLAAAGATAEPEPTTAGAVAGATHVPTVTGAPTDTIAPSDGSGRTDLVAALMTTVLAAALALGLASLRFAR